jgi:K+-transporting ATPase c subunit
MSNLLPASVIKMLDSEHKKSNQEMIIDYMISESGAVALTPKQEELLERWTKADELLRTGRFNSREVANALVKIFASASKGYSIATAWRDIEDARYVFGSTRKSNKTYRLAGHLDRIEEAMIVAQRSGDLKLLPKLFDAYTYALSMLKDDENKQQLPTAIIFNINMQNGSQLLDANFTPAEAQEQAKNALEAKGLSTEYLDYEDA